MEASTNRAVKDPMNLIISGCQYQEEDEDDLNIINIIPSSVFENGDLKGITYLILEILPYWKRYLTALG